MEHPSYSPELALKIMSAFKGRFQDTEDVQKNAIMALKAIP
jgi:hypothetical protein